MSIAEYMTLLVSEGKPVVTWRVCAEDDGVIEFLDAKGNVVASARGLT